MREPEVQIGNSGLDRARWKSAGDDFRCIEMEIIFKIEYRLGVLGMKIRGLLPQLSWADICLMMVTPEGRWPAEKLLTPHDDGPKTTKYETPIGDICWGPRETWGRFLALLVMEELRGVYERGPVRIREGDVVLDLGVFAGTFTRYALSRGAAKVVAIEPEPQHVFYLKQTFAREIEEGRVHIVNAVAWHECTKLQFRSAGPISRIAEEGGITVSAVTIDQVVADLGIERVDFIKADIEGAERHALKGAAQTIKKFGPRMALCVYHLPDDPVVIPGLVKSFRPYHVAMNFGRSQVYFWCG
jgi:FkbM family methyltransferase